MYRLLAGFLFSGARTERAAPCGESLGQLTHV
jgi:hypothetical protein